MRKTVHQKYNGHCAYCGCEITLQQMQVDHIIPKYRYSDTHDCLIVDGRKFTEYGLNDMRNLNPACRPCNNRKSAMMVEEFRAEIEQQISRLRRYSSQFRMAERFGLIAAMEMPVKFYFER